MATVDTEQKLQNRVLHCLGDDLGHTYLGTLEDIDIAARKRIIPLPLYAW